MRIIAGTARNRRIEAPEGRNTRPTLDRVRENLFNILQTRIRDSSVLDLFAGSGALSFEALSRGAERAFSLPLAPICVTERNGSPLIGLPFFMICAFSLLLAAAAANSMQSFFSGTCASRKIRLAERTVRA